MSKRFYDGTGRMRERYKGESQPYNRAVLALRLIASVFVIIGVAVAGGLSHLDGAAVKQKALP